jgi:predicted nucleotidyltransferase
VSDIDVLIVGRADGALLESALAKLERQLRREVNYVLMSPEEFKTRRAKKDAFLADVLRHPRVTLAPGP